MSKGQCVHCWHYHEAPMGEIVPSDHVYQKCCKCPESRVIHVDEAREGME
jgi:hypothetical protein